jgi:hypothetical protein
MLLIVSGKSLDESIPAANALPLKQPSDGETTRMTILHSGKPVHAGEHCLARRLRALDKQYPGQPSHPVTRFVPMTGSVETGTFLSAGYSTHAADLGSCSTSGRSGRRGSSRLCCRLAQPALRGSHSARHVRLKLELHCSTG